MAKREHLAVIKGGVEPWNEWRREHPGIIPNLRSADLVNNNLTGVDFAGADLNDAKVFGADLSKADLRGASLIHVHLARASLRYATLTRAKLIDANLFEARLFDADLSGADLTRANLRGADLTQVDLINANLRGANLIDADLSNSHLQNAHFEGSVLGHTTLGHLDLRDVNGLEAVTHLGPSIVGVDTIYLSQGKIPEQFLRGSGIPDTFITFMKSLVASGSPFEFYSCFISYSTRDDTFASSLYADLQIRGVRCWYAPEDLKIGDKFRTSIDESIRIHDKLLLVLSGDSIRSQWVEKEVETAFERERRENRIVLFPIRLDDEVMRTNESWAADIRRTRQIGDFTLWKDHDSYEKAFRRLLKDLKAAPLIGDFTRRGRLLVGNE